MAWARWLARLVTRIAPPSGVIASALLFVCAAPAAEAADGWELCNDTSFVLEAATGRSEGKGVIVEGWTRLRPGECRVAVQTIKPGVNFVFARSSSAHRGGQRVWPGDVPLCVDPNGSFAVENPSASCAAMGLVSRGFQAVRMDKASWTTRFKETENYSGGGQSPQAAGLQRLLNDAGVETVTIDGYAGGRKTQTSVRNFLADRKLDLNLPIGKVIDILEDVARNRSLEVGLMLCNRTDNRIWSAIARQRSEGWESRGWWSLDAGACVRTVDDSLLAVPHYVFAEMETPAGVRHLKGAQTIFCVSRSKFAIVSRENCGKRQFREATFAATASPEDGKLVYEFFDRDFGPTEKPQATMVK